MLWPGDAAAIAMRVTSARAGRRTTFRNDLWAFMETVLSFGDLATRSSRSDKLHQSSASDPAFASIRASNGSGRGDAAAVPVTCDAMQASNRLQHLRQGQRRTLALRILPQEAAGASDRRKLWHTEHRCARHSALTQ